MSVIEHYRLYELTNSTGAAVWMGRNANGKWRLRRVVFGGGVVGCGQVVQDSFVEGGEHVELSRG